MGRASKYSGTSRRGRGDGGWIKMTLRKDKRALQEKVESLEAENKKLREVLKKYALHLRDCPYYYPILPTSEIKCTCGLEQALKETD